MKAGDGNVNIHKMNSDGSVGTLVYDNDASWSAGWTSATFYQQSGVTYLLLLKEGNGDVHIHSMQNDGDVGGLIFDGDWRAGWSNVVAYTIGGKSFLFQLMNG